MESKSSRRFPEELKARAVQMVAGLRGETVSGRESMGRVADLLGVGTAEAVRKWGRQGEIDAGSWAGAVLSEFGVTIAPSTYCAHRARRGPSNADWADAEVIDAIWRLCQSPSLFKILGARKTWVVLRTNGIDVSRCLVGRVMREMGWRGTCKRRRVRTTVSDPAATRAPDRVRRNFVACAPDRLWVADFTYCRTRAGWAYTAFVTDVHARKIVGWKVATEMSQKLLTDAINHAIDTRKRSGATLACSPVNESSQSVPVLLVDRHAS